MARLPFLRSLDIDDDEFVELRVLMGFEFVLRLPDDSVPAERPFHNEVLTREEALFANVVGNVRGLPLEDAGHLAQAGGCAVWED